MVVETTTAGGWRRWRMAALADGGAGGWWRWWVAALADGGMLHSRTSIRKSTITASPMSAFTIKGDASSSQSRVVSPR